MVKNDIYDKLKKCYAKWLCMKQCKSRTCTTKGKCENQKRFDEILKKIESLERKEYGTETNKRKRDN